MLGVHRASATRCRWRFSPWRSPAARWSSSRWRAPSVSRWRSRSRRCSLFRERSSVVLLRLRSVGPPGRAGVVALLAPLMVLAGPHPAPPRGVRRSAAGGFPPRPGGGTPSRPGGPPPVRRGRVPAELLDATRRPPGHGDPPTGAAAHQSSSRGGRSPMRATVLCSTVAALCAACLQRADRAPPASDTSAVPDTTATPATPAPAAAPTPTPPPSPGATKLIVVEGFLTPESVLHDPAQDIYFVSNINGGSPTKDNNRFLTRLRAGRAGRNPQVNE